MSLSKTDQCYITFWVKKIKSINYLGEKCNSCFNNNIFHLEFHHNDPILKDAEINTFLQGKGGHSSKWSSIKTELDKCILLCRNCHAIKHENINPLKQKLLELKGFKGCEKCGFVNTSLNAYDFHHLEPEDKSFKLSDQYYGYTNERFIKPLETIILELDKCSVLCRNCHGMELFDLDKFKKYEKTIYQRLHKYKERKMWDLDELKDLYNSNVSYADMASAINCSRDTIIREVKKLKSRKIIKDRGRVIDNSKFRGKFNIKEIQNMFNNGMNEKEISKILKCDIKTVKNYLTDYSNRSIE